MVTPITNKQKFPGLLAGAKLSLQIPGPYICQHPQLATLHVHERPGQRTQFPIFRPSKDFVNKKIQEEIIL